MKLSAHWIRDFVDLTVDDRRLAQDLTDVGLGVEGILGNGVDTVFEMEIGTNRPDAMNHYGVAREAAAIYDLPLKAIDPKLPSAAKAVSSGTSGGTTEVVPFPIIVEEPALCPRFSVRVIHGTHIKPSPEKIAHRLQLLDQRPISNAVDATNYVLWEIGKPTHVFDADLLEGGQIVVRKARHGETLKTLDGVERKLTTDDLVVCDAKKPVGLAGIMGGYDTMITDKTRNIVIESAWWDPGNRPPDVTPSRPAHRRLAPIRARRRFRVHRPLLRSGRRNDSGLRRWRARRRYRGRDLEANGPGAGAAARLRSSSPSRRQSRGGTNFPPAEAPRIRTLIPEGQGDAQFRVQIPSWRLDVEREIDVIEEIARLHGYNRFANTLPAYSGAVVELPHAPIDATLRQRALALGYNEALSLTFISHADAERFSSASGPQVLELENPLSEEASVMRTSLVPGMLDMLAWNLNRDVADARLFEVGSVYELTDGERSEPRRACLGATVTAVQRSLPTGGALDVSKGEHASASEAFRGFKGDIESLLTAFAGEMSYDRETSDYFHPGRSSRARVNGATVAQFGQVDPEVAAARKLRQAVFLAEFDLEQLYKLGLRTIRFTPLAKYPAVERDFSFVFSDDITFEEMRKAVVSAGVAELQEFRPAEIFRGGSIGAGKYSVLLRARFQSSGHTLRDDEIAQWSAKIVAALTTLGGVQRA